MISWLFLAVASADNDNFSIHFANQLVLMDRTINKSPPWRVWINNEKNREISFLHLPFDIKLFNYFLGNIVETLYRGKVNNCTVIWYASTICVDVHWVHKFDEKVLTLERHSNFAGSTWYLLLSSDNPVI